MWSARAGYDAEPICQNVVNPPPSPGARIAANMTDGWGAGQANHRWATCSRDPVTTAQPNTFRSAKTARAPADGASLGKGGGEKGEECPCGGISFSEKQRGASLASRPRAPPIAGRASQHLRAIRPPRRRRLPAIRRRPDYQLRAMGQILVLKQWLGREKGILARRRGTHGLVATAPAQLAEGCQFDPAWERCPMNKKQNCRLVAIRPRSGDHLLADHHAPASANHLNTMQPSSGRCLAVAQATITGIWFSSNFAADD